MVTDFVAMTFFMRIGVKSHDLLNYFETTHTGDRNPRAPACLRVGDSMEPFTN
jgi:hypothetical protein